MPGGQSTQWVATARMLRRAGFGVTGPEVDAAVSRDWPGYVDAMLSTNPDADPGAVATPMPSLEPPRATLIRMFFPTHELYGASPTRMQSADSPVMLS